MTSVQTYEDSDTPSASKNEQCKQCQQIIDIFELSCSIVDCKSESDDAHSSHEILDSLNPLCRKTPCKSVASLETQSITSKNATTSSSSSLKQTNSWPSEKQQGQRSTSGCGTSVGDSTDDENSEEETEVDKSLPKDENVEEEANGDVEAENEDGVEQHIEPEDDDDYFSSLESWEEDSSFEDDEHENIQNVLKEYRDYVVKEEYPAIWLDFIDEFLMPLSEPLVYYVLCTTNRLPFRFRAFHRTMKEETNYWTLFFKRKANLYLQLPYSHKSWDPNAECCVCYRYLGGLVRACCNQVVCEDCLNNYFISKVETEGVVQITCPSCPKLCERNEISFHLPTETKNKFYRFLVNANNDPKKKTCPKCSYIMQRPKDSLTRKEKRYGLHVRCPQCNFYWCFSCHAPAHTISCSKFRSGDILLRQWTKEFIEGQGDSRNARRCPGCRVYIQRSDGCDHMQCSQCGKRFCYACGRTMRSVFIIGSHNVRLSVLGCSKSFMPKRPHLRRFVRGSIFSLGVLASPVALVGAGVAGLFVGTFLGGRFIIRRVNDRIKSIKDRRRQVNGEVVGIDFHDFGEEYNPGDRDDEEEESEEESGDESEEEEGEGEEEEIDLELQRRSSADYVTQL